MLCIVCSPDTQVDTPTPEPLLGNFDRGLLLFLSAELSHRILVSVSVPVSYCCCCCRGRLTLNFRLRFPPSSLTPFEKHHKKGFKFGLQRLIVWLLFSYRFLDFLALPVPFHIKQRPFFPPRWLFTTRHSDTTFLHRHSPSSTPQFSLQHCHHWALPRLNVVQGISSVLLSSQ